MATQGKIPLTLASVFAFPIPFPKVRECRSIGSAARTVQEFGIADGERSLTAITFPTGFRREKVPVQRGQLRCKHLNVSALREHAPGESKKSR
jgi:hypothetical protein